MVDHVKALGYKITLPKAGVFVFTLLLFFYVAPVEEFNVLRTISFESLVISYWLAFVGLALLVEGLASLPESKRGTSQFGALILIGLGGIAFIFSATSLFLGYDVLRDSTELRLMTTFLFGLTSVLLFITLIPEIFARKSFVSKLRNF